MATITKLAVLRGYITGRVARNAVRTVLAPFNSNLAASAATPSSRKKALDHPDSSPGPTATAGVEGRWTRQPGRNYRIVRAQDTDPQESK